MNIGNNLRTPYNIKELTNIFKLMKKFSIQNLALGDIIIERSGDRSDPAQSPHRSPSTLPLSAADDGLKSEKDSSSQPPSSPQFSPEDFDNAIYNIRDVYS